MSCAGALEQTLLMPAFSIPTARRDGALLAEVPGKGEIELFAESETDFFVRVMDAQVVFVRDASGVVTGLVLHQGGIEQRGLKVR